MKSAKMVAVCIGLAISQLGIIADYAHAADITYSYDSLGRLSQAQYGNTTLKYTYDAAGNRTSVTTTVGATQSGALLKLKAKTSRIAASVQEDVRASTWAGSQARQARLPTGVSRKAP